MFITPEGSIEDYDPTFVAQLICCCANRISRNMSNTPRWHEREQFYLGWDLGDDGCLNVSFSDSRVVSGDHTMRLDLDLHFVYPSSLIIKEIQEILTNRGWNFRSFKQDGDQRYLIITRT